MRALKYFSLFLVANALASLSGDSAHNYPYHSPEMNAVLRSVDKASDRMHLLGIMSDLSSTRMSVDTWILSYNFLNWSKKLNVTGFTIFAPIDSAFISDIITPTETLLLHYSPVYYSLRTLRFKTKIPTISRHYNLIITSSYFASEISICNVKISAPPIYDDGYVIVYSIEQLFNINCAKDMMAGHKEYSSNRIIHAEL